MSSMLAGYSRAPYRSGNHPVESLSGIEPPFADRKSAVLTFRRQRHHESELGSVLAFVALQFAFMMERVKGIEPLS